MHLTSAAVILDFLPRVLLVVAVVAMPQQIGWLGWLCVSALFTVQTALLFGFGIKILRWMRLVEPAGPRLTTLVEEASRSASVKARATWELLVPSANAAVLVTTRDLLVTRKLLQVAPDDELKAILAHELGHLSEGRLIVIARLVGALAAFPLIFVRPVVAAYGANGMAILAVTTLALFIGSRRLAHVMEKRADRIAVESVVGPGTYARALERLYRTNHMPAVTTKSVGRIHPNLYDRMLAANVTPDFPRPEAPGQHSLSAALVIVLCMITGIICFVPSF
jgi:Zn-dependent protease with chaperone function